MIFYKTEVGLLQTNCYILVCPETKEAVIVDPGGEPEKIEKIIEKEKLKPVMVINTHGHYDHIGGNYYFRNKNIPIAIHNLDAKMMMAGGGSSMLGIKSEKNPPPDMDLSEKKTISFGKEILKVFFTPGHTPGHISLYHEKSGRLLCGDVLFFRSVGRTDLPGGDHDTLIKSIRDNLLPLPEETMVYPGHGPETKIGDEIKYNPWLE